VIWDEPIIASPHHHRLNATEQLVDGGRRHPSRPRMLFRPLHKLGKRGSLQFPCPPNRKFLQRLSHGCMQDAGTIGRLFIEQTGYNAWADANGIIVLYPQAKAYPSFLSPTSAGYIPSPRTIWTKTVHVAPNPRPIARKPKGARP
jgi:hypothetical protein